MRHFHLHRNAEYCPVINIDRLWSLVSADTRKFAETAKDGKATVIDVTKAGYTKVLGTGPLPKIPLIVKARMFSKTAEKRIKEAGGVCQLTA